MLGNFFLEKLISDLKIGKTDIVQFYKITLLKLN